MLSLDHVNQNCIPVKSFFVTLFEHNVMPELAEVNVIEMEGWKLFECHLFSPNKVCYIGLDEDSKNPECIESDEETYLHYFNPLIESLNKVKAF